MLGFEQTLFLLQVLNQEIQKFMQTRSMLQENS